LKNLHYVTNIEKLKEFDGKRVAIIDEADAVIFKALKKFYEATKSPDITVIALTATPDDGDDESIEHQALQALGYVTYKMSKVSDPVPKITKKIDLSTADLVLAEVEARKPT
jgi:late competence protein required for DNA uptake (superfamily II DNA/RNA helicase)